MDPSHLCAHGKLHWARQSCAKPRMKIKKHPDSEGITRESLDDGKEELKSIVEEPDDKGIRGRK